MIDRFPAMQCRSLLTCCSTPSAIRLRNATPSVFHQRHIGRVLRSSTAPLFFQGIMLCRFIGSSTPSQKVVICLLFQMTTDLTKCSSHSRRNFRPEMSNGVRHHSSVGSGEQCLQKITLTNSPGGSHASNQGQNHGLAALVRDENLRMSNFRGSNPSEWSRCSIERWIEKKSRISKSIWQVFSGRIFSLQSSFRYENVLHGGKVICKFTVRAQHSVKPNRDRIPLGSEIAGLKIRQQTPQNPTRVFKGELNRVHAD
jgi:hypothetical protein